MHVEIAVPLKNKLLLSWFFPYVVFEPVSVFISQFHRWWWLTITYFSSLFVIVGVTYKFDNSKHEDSTWDNEEFDNPGNENKDDNVMNQDMSSDVSVLLKFPHVRSIMYNIY